MGEAKGITGPDRGHSNELAKKIGLLEESVPDLALLLGHEKLAPFRRRLEELELKLARCGGPLHLGLLGGTGTGKSTLINAVASAPVSGTSDRRPHTHHAVVYRHRDGIEEPLPLAGEFILSPHRVHDNDALRNLVIYDMPDFDSIRPEHRRLVAGSLTQLDVVLWVVSPEKYADRAFYEMLDASPQARANFGFVFNKIDLLVDEQGRYSAEQAERALSAFTHKLREHGVEEPRLFALSARWAAENTEQPSNEGFERLIRYLEREFEEKKIRAIKLSNLDREFNLVASGLNARMKTELLAKALGGLRVQLEEQWRDVEQSAADAASETLKEQGTTWIDEILLEEGRNVGPVVAFIRFRLGFRKLFEGKPRPVEHMPFLRLPEPSVKGLAARIDFIRHRLVSELGRYMIPVDHEALASSGERETQGLKTLCEEAALEMNGMVETLSRVRRRKFSFSRMRQSFLLLVPVAMMVGYLLDSNLVDSFLSTYDWSILPRMVFGFFLTLFTSRGLTALCSSILLEILLVVWLGARSMRSMESDAREMRDSLAERFGKLVAGRLGREKDRIAEYLDSLGRAVQKAEKIRELAKE